MAIIVLLNAAAGRNAATARRGRDHDDRIAAVRQALLDAGIDPDIQAVPGERLMQAARSAIAQRPRAIVAVGGDGTVSAVAAAAAGSDVPLGIMPLGTLNHFARDLHLPPDLNHSARIIAAGNVARVDVGRVNDHIFVNNASIGMYPQVVRHRDDIRHRLGRGKWSAMLTAILTVFRLFPTVRLRMSANGQTFLRTTPFVFIGNNQYRLDLFSLGQRQRLDQGDLCLYFTNRAGRTGLLRLALRTIFTRLSQDRDFNAVCAREVWIDASRRRINIALDGEALHLRPPLHFRIWPGALSVLVPAAAVPAAAAPAAAVPAAPLSPPTPAEP